jgi:hypothetical protein
LGDRVQQATHPTDVLWAEAQAIGQIIGYQFKTQAGQMIFCCGYEAPATENHDVLRIAL